MVRAILLDLSGVLYEGDAAMPHAADAVARLRAAGLPLRFLTNSTRRPKARLFDKLRGFGMAPEPGEMFTPAQAACDRLAEEGWTPHLLVHPELEADFAACRKDGPLAVVIGDAGRFFTYPALNTAFRHLLDGAPFLALAANRTFRDADGDLSMDAGGFVAALEYASGARAEVLGKPAPAFFAAAAESIGVSLGDVAMIGDDAEADVAGALDAGARAGILVRTGKYRSGDETRFDPQPSWVADDIGDAVDWLLSELRTTGP